MLDLGSLPAIRGAAAIVAYHTRMFEQVRETLTIHALDASDERLVVDCTCRFTALADAPDFPIGRIGKGGRIDLRAIVTCTLVAGRIHHSGVRRTGVPVLHRS